MRTRNILIGAAGAVALGYVLNRMLQSKKDITALENANARAARDEDVDAYVDDSFPASDPPSWSPGGSFH